MYGVQDPAVRKSSTSSRAAQHSTCSHRHSNTNTSTRSHYNRAFSMQQRTYQQVINTMPQTHRHYYQHCQQITSRSTLIQVIYSGTSMSTLATINVHVKISFVNTVCQSIKKSSILFNVSTLHQDVNTINKSYVY